MNILYIGSSGPLSILPLKNILQTQHSICAVAMEANQTNTLYNHLFPVQTTQENTSNTHLDTFAKQNNLPVIIFNSNLQSYAEDIKHYAPDVILVSCFGKKLPSNILSIPRYGCINLHPSLLPEFQGPTPVFWQFKNGTNLFGITLHRMTEDFDAGDIIKQSSIQLDHGIHHQQAKLQLAHLAADLITDTLNDFPGVIENSTPQDKQLSSYYSYPRQDDYRVSVSWTAKRMYNFLKAYQNGSTLFPCEINGRTFNLIEAISYDDNSDCEFKLIHDQLTLPCFSGCLTARILHDSTFQ